MICYTYVMKRQKLVILLAAFFLIFGTLELIPLGIISGKMFGLFEVAPLHSIVYLLSGLAALWGFTTAAEAKLYCRIFAGLYALMAIIGWIQGSFFNLFSLSLADNILHSVLTLLLVWFGLVKKGK